MLDELGYPPFVQSGGYSAMLLNRLLRRRGHFWERRYHAATGPDRDCGHALRVLRYIHANPRAAGMIQSYAYP